MNNLEAVELETSEQVKIATEQETSEQIKITTEKEITEEEQKKLDAIEKAKRKVEFLADIKVLFDALRNMGLCMVFIFSAHFGFSNDTAGTTALKYIGYFVGVLLISINVYWAYNSSIQKGIRLITISGLIALFIFQGVGLYQLKDIVLDTPTEISKTKG